MLLGAAIAAQIAIAAQTPPSGPMPTAPTVTTTLPVPYTSIEGWDVMIDLDMSFSCFVMGRFNSGTTIRIGVDRSRKIDPGYVVVANPAWAEFSNARDYDLSIRFDQDKPRTARARASTTTGITALVFRFADRAFVRDFSIHQAMAISSQGREIARLDLTASQKAIRTLITCQQDVDRVVSQTKEQDDEDNAKEKATETT